MESISSGESEMQLVLQGKIQTPIISKKTIFFIKGCKAQIIKPRGRYFNKITSGKPMFPYSLICYLGDIELRYHCNSISKIKRKLNDLLKINSIGRYSSEGLGRIQWLKGYSIKFKQLKKGKQYPRLKIRKGLPHNLPEEIQELIRYSLLHDFFHTPQHRSKIYVEPQLEDEKFLEQLRKHHEKIEDPLIRTFQIFDQRASLITRKIRSPTYSRYKWQTNQIIKKVDFDKIAQEIKEVSSNVLELYQYVYHSKELGLLNESLQYGHSSLRQHLLVITALIVLNFRKGELSQFLKEVAQKHSKTVTYPNDGRRAR